MKLYVKGKLCETLCKGYFKLHAWFGSPSV